MHDFKPTIDKRSIQLTTKKAGTSQSLTRGVDRTSLLIQKGLEYKEKREKMVKDKESQG